MSSISKLNSSSVRRTPLLQMRRQKYVLTNSLKYVCGECHTKIPTADLEGIFYEQLHGFLVSPHEVTAYLKRAENILDDKRRLVEFRKKAAEKNRQEIERMRQLYVEGHISGEAFAEFIRPLKERQKQLAAELPRLQAELDFLTINAFSCDQVAQDANDHQSRWPSLEQEEKRKVIECITSRIVIEKDGVSLDLCYLPSSKEITKRDWSLGDSNP